MRFVHACLFVLLASGGCTATAVVGSGGFDGGGASASTSTGVSSGPGATTSGFTTSGTAQTTTASGSASTGGVACVPVDCADGEPCTIDVCQPTGVCTHAPRPVGTPGDVAEGACEGVCQTDGHCGLALYRRDIQTPTWTKRALSEVWTGTDAPPPRGILGVEAGSTYEIIAVADDGMVYRRIGGAWLPPQSGQTLFGIDVTLATSMLGSSFDGTDYVSLAFMEGGLHKLVTATVVGANMQPGMPIEGIELTGYPAQSQRMDWAMTMTTAGEGLVQWFRFEDQMVYRWNMNGFNGASPETMSDVWGDPATAPAADTVRDAFAVGTEIQLVAP